MDKKKRKGTCVPPQVPFEGGDEALHSDVQGSWTGTPLYDDVPVQDADDL